MRVYTDGSSLNNQNDNRCAGCAFCVIDSNNNLVYKYGKSLGNKTNNYAELIAVYYSLIWIEKNITIIDKSIEYYIDSLYTINTITNKYKSKKNLELISIISTQINNLENNYNVTFKYKHVKGHNGDKYNELVDKIAKEYAK